MRAEKRKCVNRTGGELQIGEVKRKGETVQGWRNRSQGRGGGHGYVTKLFLFKCKT